MTAFKKIAAALVSGSVIFPLAGCGSENNAPVLDPKSPVTVTVWHYYNGVQQTTFDSMVSEFNDTVGLEKGIIVEAFSKASINELSSAVLASVRGDAGAENPPDIFTAYSETAYTVDKMGMLADLTQYLSDDEIASYVDAYINEGEFSDNSVKIFPTAKSTEIMMLNKTDWDTFANAQGVSTDDLATIEGVTRVAEMYFNYTDSLTPDIDGDGKAFFGRDSVANYMYIGGKQLGTEYVTINADGSGTVNVDKDAVRKLWDNYYVPFVKGYFTAKSRFRSDDTKTGNIISMVCSTTGAAYFPTEVSVSDDESYPIEHMVLSCPYFEGKEPFLVQQGAGMSVIRSDEKSEYAGVVFLKWFTEEERNIRFCMDSGYMPVLKSANSFDKIVAVSNTLDEPLDNIMLDTFSIAVRDVNSRPLYTARSFDNSADTRDYIGDYMSDTADAAYAQAAERIADGEVRDTVLDEYTNDAAFDKWYDEFLSGLYDVVAG